MVTGERYVGSSVNVKQRWAEHKCSSTCKKHQNSKLYKDFQEYGLDNFMFAILAPVEPEYLKQVEQDFIDMLNPAYNSNRANGSDVERIKESQKRYRQSEKGKTTRGAYLQSEKCKESNSKSNKKYYNRLCNYNGEILSLNTLASRFYKAGIPHPTQEAKKYLIQ